MNSRSYYAVNRELKHIEMRSKRRRAEVVNISEENENINLNDEIIESAESSLYSENENSFSSSTSTGPENSDHLNEFKV